MTDQEKQAVVRLRESKAKKTEERTMSTFEQLGVGIE